MAAVDSPAQTAQALHYSAPMSNFALGYHPTGFIAEQVFPVMSVKHESDLYYKWDRDSAFRLDRTDGKATYRADGTVAREAVFGTTQDGYRAEARAMRVRVTDREEQNADDVLDLQRSRVRRAQDLVLVDQELYIAGLLQTDASYNLSGQTTNLVTDATTTQWDNSGFASLGTAGTGHSLIVAQILKGVKAIRKNTGGMRPNKMILPFDVAVVMANDPGMADLNKYVVNLAAQQSGNALSLVPPTFLGMDVLIPYGQYQSAVEGETGSLTDIWGKDVILAYVPPTPMPDDLAAGFIFRSQPWNVFTYREDQIRATWYEAQMVQDVKVVTTDALYRIKTAVS